MDIPQVITAHLGYAELVQAADARVYLYGMTGRVTAGSFHSSGPFKDVPCTKIQRAFFPRKGLAHNQGSVTCHHHDNTGGHRG